MKVLVTGATGFVGRHLCQGLCDAGHTVVAATRRARAPELPDDVAIANVGDLNAETAWSDVLEGVDGVMHLAARTHVMKETARDAEAAYARINVEATAHLVAQASAAGVRRLVFLSSVKAVAEQSLSGPLTEEHRPHPEDAYGRTKRAAEEIVLRADAENRLEGVVLRPPLIYGPGQKGNLLTLFNAVNSGLPLPLGAVDNRRSVVYVGNLVAAMIALLDADVRGCAAFVSDGEDVSTAELIRRIGAALDRPARLFPVPLSLLTVAGRLTGRSSAVQRVTGSLQVDDGPFRSALDWSPPFTMKEGLEHTAAWYKSRHDD